MTKKSGKRRITPSTGPTPVGQRNRAQTIPAKRHDGPTADEWDDLFEEEFGMTPKAFVEGLRGTNTNIDWEDE